MGGFQGDLKHATAAELGAAAIKAALERAGLSPDQIDEVVFGCVLPAGQGQAPARQAALGAGLPTAAGATTINKMCGSGMKAAMFAHDLILAGSANIVVAGGMESMTNAPYLLDRARGGYRLGHGKVIDHMFLDGLEDAYDKGRLMGTFAEDCAQTFQFTREAQDDYALASLTRAQKAIADGSFAGELAPVTMRSGRTEATVTQDEQPGKARPDKIRSLKPAFREGGTVTAGNASGINDGAAALVIASEEKARELGVEPLGAFVGSAVAGVDPRVMGVGPIPAVRKVLERRGLAVDDLDLIELNEAFASQSLAVIRELGLDPEKVNVNGGAIALGHPLGMSGARLVVSLLHELRRRNGRYGLATLCVGVGQGQAALFERN
jgi:acetyl-CoA C-acetyltransferase